MARLLGGLRPKRERSLPGRRNCLPLPGRGILCVLLVGLVLVSCLLAWLIVDVVGSFFSVAPFFVFASRGQILILSRPAPFWLGGC